MLQAQSDQAGLPAISQQVVREGDFAVRLHAALGLGSTENETQAESQLGKVGVLPRNGWIADYPVTPDIIGELRQSVSDATAAGKLPLGREEALNRLDSVAAEVGLGVRPYAGPAMDQSAATQYPDSAVVNSYYETQGPPIVTYYAPPPDYYYLYDWIPYPFWWAGFWYPGYFILLDFHRSFRFHNRVCFVSNHFNDVRSHRVFRIDPRARFSGRTFAGIGVTNRSGFLSTGVARSERAIFNAPRAQAAPGMRPLPGMRSSFHSTVSSPATTSAPSRSGTRTFSAPSQSGGSRSFAVPSGGGRPVGSPSSGGGGGFHGGGRR